MRYLRLRLGLAPEHVHPMHEFVADRDDYGHTRLLQWNVAGEGAVAMIFRVDGEVEPYEAVLEELASIDRHEVLPAADGGFFVYVRERLSEENRRLVDALARGNVIVLPPVVYRTDRTMDLDVVGSDRDLQRTVDGTPDEIDVEVLSVGEYRTGGIHQGERLTARQREAVRAAADLGYYEQPREADVEDVAERLGCAPGTAAEHLRKAQATLARRVVEPGTPLR